MPQSQKVIIIGSGFAGLSAACFMAKAGWDVTVLEKNNQPGGRAAQWKEQGFVFDMGPSFYWMPDVFDRFFQQFGKSASDYYTLHRLDPSYKIYWPQSATDIPASYLEIKDVFESMEPGSSVQLDKYLEGAAYKYEVGINNLVYKPALSVTEFFEWKTISGVFKLQVFSSIKKHIQKYFKDQRLRQLMEFPVLFLGALPEDTPALYSLMNYADFKGGTWYPQGGMYKVVEAMHQLAEELGVTFKFNEEVTGFNFSDNRITEVITSNEKYTAEAVISGADYHFTETSLLPERLQSYSKEYWQKRVMAPSCLLYYVGINKKIPGLQHHSLFFDVPFEQHGQEIYRDPKWPTAPLFYVSAASVTDPTVAPQGCENLVFLIPIAAGLTDDSEERREYYFNAILDRFEKRLGQSVRDSIFVKRSYSISNFIQDHHSYRGNAYGLANTLRQTAIFRPSCKSKKVHNLYYTGQLTVPGPGVPPSLISGEVVAAELQKNQTNN